MHTSVSIDMSLSCFVLLSCLTIAYSLQFREVTSELGLSQSRPTWKFGGPHVADLDNDGRYDIIFSYHNDKWVQIFFQNDSGRFEEAKFRTSDFDVHGVAVAATTAYSKERILIVSVGGGKGTNLKSAEIFFVSKDRKFRPISNRIGFGQAKGRGRNAVFMDMAMRSRAQGRLNGGGPDVLFTNYVGYDTKLKQYGYENRKGLFQLKRVGDFENQERGRVEVTDVEGDGKMEVIAIRDLKFYKLTAPFTLTESTDRYLPEELRIGELAVTAVAEFDFDNDGDFDLYIARASRRLSTFRPDLENTFENDLILENIGGKYKLANFDGLTGDTMGVTIGDFDNDGLVDVYCVRWQGGDVVLRNLGGGKFEKKTPATKPGIGNHAVAVDLEGDGKVDVIVGQGDRRGDGRRGLYRVMRNVGKWEGGWLLVRVGNEWKGGVTCLHAVVKVWMKGGGQMVRRVGSVGAQAGGGSFLDTVHFGLGERAVDKVEVTWTNGVKEIKSDVNRNSKVTMGRI